MPPIPVFLTKRLKLRAVTEADAPAWHKHFADYEVIRHLNRAVPWSYPAEGVLEYIRTKVQPDLAKGRWNWAILLKENPSEMIGCVELWRVPNPANRGFWLGRNYWGQGIMSEALIPVTDYAFDHLGFEKLYFDNAKGNHASHRIKQKAGARLIGVDPAEFVDPSYTERELWELTKEEWKSPHFE